MSDIVLMVMIVGNSVSLMLAAKGLERLILSSMRTNERHAEEVADLRRQIGDLRELVAATATEAAV